MQFKESKYKVGDKVATIDLQKMQIIEFTVAAVSVTATATGQDVYLRGEDYTSYDENRCFSSRQELIDYIGRN